MNDKHPVQDHPGTVRALLDANASQHPGLVMLRFDSGETFTADELRTRVRDMAANLQHLGIRHGDYVLSWLPNGPLSVLLYLSLNYLGAISVPFNIAYRGRLLEHVIATSGASCLIADGRLTDRLQDIDTANLDTVIIDGDERLAAQGLKQLPVSMLETPGNADTADFSTPIQDTDTAAVIFTSGTTGPSKGVLCSYRHLHTSAMEFRHVGPGDTNLVALPMFHVGGILGIWFALVHGGCAAFVERFSTTAFWDTVRKMQASSVGLLGAMVQYLMAQPSSTDERDHPVKRAVIAPFGDDALAFGKRFGIEVHTEFNMTELSVPTWGGPNPTARGSCGKARPGVKLKLVNDQGQNAGDDEIGEMWVKPDDPWTISHGYLNNPEATADSRHEGWFMTGDLFTRDADGNYYFVDRKKDALRRKGENISSFEVEEELLAFPGISAAAVVAAPGDGGEDEILAILETGNGKPADITALTDFLTSRLAHYMVPRYFRFVSTLPRTPTQKIEKHVLRAEGLTTDTIDREALGLVIKADKLLKR